MDNLLKLIEIKKYKNQEMTLETDVVIREISFTIFVNKKELAFGFLYSEGLILSDNEIETFEFNFEEKYINFQLHIPQERINKFFQTGEIYKFSAPYSTRKN